MQTFPRLPKIDAYMDVKVAVLAPHTPILEAVDFLLTQHVTGAPVVNEQNKLIGMLTEKDCLRLLAVGVQGEPVSGGTVADFMTRDVVTIALGTDLYYAAGVFLKHHFRRLPVIHHHKLVGAITRFDILRAIKANMFLVDSFPNPV